MMRRVVAILFVLAFVSPVFAQKGAHPEIKQLQSPQNPRIGFIIHGGAGVITKATLTPELEAQYKAKLTEAVTAGYKALVDGKSSLDAVEIAIKMLEDSPLFNAGKGAVFTNDGRNELDSSIMDGRTLAAGSAAALHKVKNPITLARAIMEKSPHVMMIGDGAEKFAKEQSIELVDEKYFWTQRRWDELEAEKAKVKSQKAKFATDDIRQSKYGTVGAVALDRKGNIAAGTSTGGMTNKRYGRVGDSPIIGAGTYANNDTCGVSGTGWGEYFIRVGVARDISSMMEYRAMTVQAAADAVMAKVKKLGGDGGVVAMDKFGNMAVSFNSEGMYRAYISGEGKPVVEIYK